MENGFGIKKSKGTFNDYIGKYIIVDLPGETIAGKYIGEDEKGLYMFNPYQGIDYSSGIPKLMLINRNKKLSIPQVPFFTITPTTKKSLEGYCEYSNKHQKLISEINEKNIKE